MAINHNYEVSSEGAVRHWEVPYARLMDATPEETHAAELLSTLGTGIQLTGTVLTLDADDSIAVIDFTPGMVYRKTVRNVRTYGGGPVEATWGVINIGDPIYYDRGALQSANDVQLSTSPLDQAGVANALFGFAMDDGSLAFPITWPMGAAGATTVSNVPVMQIGCGR
jgi:hypothetical protein